MSQFKSDMSKNVNKLLSVNLTQKKPAKAKYTDAAFFGVEYLSQMLSGFFDDFFSISVQADAKYFEFYINLKRV